MFKQILSFFWPEEPDTDKGLKEAYLLLASIGDDEEASPVDAVEEKPNVALADYSCCTRTGFVTGAADDVYTIDNKFEFTSSLQNFQVGLKVSFTVYTVEGEVKVSEVAVHDDWFSGYSQATWCQRSLICKVIKRVDRKVYLEPGDVWVDLDRIFAQFIPIVGDWIVLEAKVKIDENVLDLFGNILEVEKVCPLRLHNLHGWVKKWCSKTRLGVINREVFFNGDVLCPGYLPISGDRVVATVMESEQEWYKLRALIVLPEKHAELFLDDAHMGVDFVPERDGISVSDNVFIKAKKLNGSYKFLFEIVNQSSTNVILSRVNLPSPNSQCEIRIPIFLTDIEISSGASVILEGVCKAGKTGTKRELIIFQFADCKVGKWITVNLESSKMNRIGAGRTGLNHRPARLLWKDKTLLNAPRFVSQRLPEYSVPQKLLDLVLKYECRETPKEFINKLGATNPCLALPLTYSTYEDRFHTLLHLEEIDELVSLRAYSQDEVHFVKTNEFLMMVTDNLAEKRPSLIVGDKILAKHADNSDDLIYEGVIQEVGVKRVCIKFDPSYHSAYNDERVSIRVVAPRKRFRRMHQAVVLGLRNLKDFLFPVKVVEKAPQIDFRSEAVSDTLLGQVKKNVDCFNKMPRIEVKGGAQTTISILEQTPRQRRLEWHNNNLEYFQKESVCNILLGVARPLPYIILGAPGTGKTVTLVETILQLLRLLPHSRILVATSSNNAANLIALPLIDSGLMKAGDLIRLVDLRCAVKNRLPVRMVPYCATADVACEETRGEMSTLESDGLVRGCSSSVIGRHRITIGTCTSLGSLFNMSFPLGHFTHVIVDEAAGIVEPEVMIPLSFVDPKVGQIILAGDPLQLGPVISSKGASAYGFEETFLDRLLSRLPYGRDFQAKSDCYDPRLVTRLVQNYRSLPQLISLANKLFYEDQLISMISASESDAARVLSRVKEILPVGADFSLPAVVFHGVTGDNCQTEDCPSWFNPNEVSLIFYYVNELYRLGLEASHIGIITPYIKQVRQIRALLEKAELDVPKVGTVEDFQGEEFNVILVSTVRSDESFTSYDLKYKLGFLSNPRRVNFAITRAKALVIVVGNPHLLCKDLHWKSILVSATYHGCDLLSSN